METLKKSNFSQSDLDLCGTAAAWSFKSKKLRLKLLKKEEKDYKPGSKNAGKKYLTVQAATVGACDIFLQEDTGRLDAAGNKIYEFSETPLKLSDGASQDVVLAFSNLKAVLGAIVNSVDDFEEVEVVTDDKGRFTKVTLA